MQVLVGYIITAVLNWLEKFFADHIAAYERDQANKQKSADQATADTAKAGALTPESKPDEVSSAIDDELKHL